MNLGRNVKVTRIKIFEGTGQGTVTSDELDMTGFEGCVFLVAMGEIVSGAATTCYVRQDTVTGMGGGVQLTGTVITITDSDDDKILLMDVYRPKEQFLDVIVTRTVQNSEVDSITAIQYNGRKTPVTHDSSTVASETYVAGPTQV